MPGSRRRRPWRAAGRCRFPLGPFTRSYVLLWQGVVQVEEGDYGEALRLVREAGALAELHGFDAWLFANSIVGRSIEGLLADDTDGAALAAEVLLSVQVWHAMGVRVLTGFLQCLVCRVLLHAGEHDGAMTVAKEAIATAAETGSVAFVAEALRVLALARPPEQVETGLLEALARAEEQGAVILAVRIADDLVRTSGRAHRPRLATAVERIRSDADYPDLAAARALLATPPDRLVTSPHRHR